MRRVSHPVAITAPAVSWPRSGRGVLSRAGVGVLCVALALSAHATVRASDLDADSDRGVERKVFTLLDHYARGREAVEAFVRDHEASEPSSGIAQTIRRSQEACVQLEIRFRHAGSYFESTIASGVMIDAGRRILTAGHVFEGTGEAEIVVRYAGGTTRSARLVAREYARFGGPDQDWAVLEVSTPPGTVSAPPDLARLVEGDLVFVVGYPDGIGVDASGELAYASPSGERYHEPLVGLAVVERVDPLSLAPLVGSIPTRGISGGPIFDTQGRLAGIFVSVSSTRIDDEVTHSYDACSADVPARRLR